MRPGTVIDERFELEERVGAGGMGAVFRARDRDSGLPVAVKILDALADESRFAREIRILAELDHPAIVGYSAHGVHEGRPYLVMEWLEGEDLAERLDYDELAIDEAVTLVARIAEAVGFAHARGIVHRDLKPANVFLPGREAARAKLLDFGVARTALASRAATRTGALVGTPAYMAPEQASGGRDVDARADVFALGCLLFETLGGRPAFLGDHWMAVLAKVLFEEPPRLRSLRSEVPARLEALVARMLAKDPAARPADGHAVAVALAELSGASTSAEPSAREPEPAVTSLGRAEQRLVTVLLASAAGTGAAFGRADTLPAGALATETLKGLRAILASLPAQVEQLLDGSVVAVLVGFASAVDQASQAARCALALRHKRPGVTIALSTGRALVSGALPVGEAIDRAAQLVRRSVGDAIVLDEVTASLLPQHFVVAAEGDVLLLREEREPIEAARTVLGQATRCLGRDKELAFLRGSYEECVDEPVARAVLVTAPPGVGKTRLRIELTSQLGKSAAIWLARGDALAAGSPLGVVARALRHALGLRAGEPPDAQERKIRARLAPRFDDAELEGLTPFVGELAGAPIVSGEPQWLAARRDPQLMSDRLQAAFIEVLRAETATRPVVLVLEDLQFGDRASVDYVDAALKALPDRPLLVLAFARPEIHEVLPGLWSQRDVNELRLAPLTRGASRRLVREVLGSEVADDTVQQIVAASGGNAFYLEELMRAHAEGLGEGAPTTVVAMAQARLETFDPEARRVLRAASVFGEIFWRGAVAHLLGTTFERLGPRLDELVAREVVVRQSGGRFLGEEELAFGHALVREAAYRALTDEDRALGHALAAAWLERAGENDPMTLAEHHERGGEGERAVEWFHRAAEQALEGGDIDAAVARAERGITCGAHGEARGRLRQVQAAGHDWRGDNAEAVRWGREAMKALAPDDLAWHRAACSVSVAARRLGWRDELEGVGRELGAIEPRAFRGAVARACAGRSALQLAVAGFREVATTVLARVDQAAPSSPDTLGEMWLWAARGMISFIDGDPTLLLRDADRAIEVAEASGDQRSASNFHLYVATAGNALGCHDVAERHARSGIARAERIRGAPNLSPLRMELATAALGQGRHEEGRAFLERTLEQIRLQGDRFQEGRAEEQLALSFLAEGHPAEAEPCALRAVELTAVAPPFQRRAMVTLARVHLTRSEPRAALEASEHALEIQAGTETAWDGAALLVQAEALWALDRRDEARATIARARAQLEASVERFVDPSWKEAYLAMPHRARTLALAETWSR